MNRLICIVGNVLSSFLWITVFLPQCVSAQEYTYFEGRTEIFSEDHFPILQDKHGFLWGANLDGTLFRFDGFEYRYYHTNPTDSQGLLGQIQFGFKPFAFEDKEGKLYFFVDGHFMTRYDPIIDQFQYFHDLTGFSLNNNESLQLGTNIYEEEDGSLWIGSQTAIFHHNPNTLGENQVYTVQDEIFFYLFIDSKGETWSAGWQGLWKFDSQKKELELKHSLHKTMNPFVEKLGQNKFLFYGAEAATHPPMVFNATKNEIYRLDIELQEQEEIRSAHKTPNSVLLGTNQGRLLSYSEVGDSITTIFINPDGQSISNIFQDHNGVLFIISNRSYKILPDQQIEFTKKSLPRVRGVNYRYFIKHNNSIYLFTRNGLEVVNGNLSFASVFNNNFHRKENFRSPNAGPIARGDGHIWISSIHDGMYVICKYDSLGNLVSEYSPPEEARPSTILIMDLSLDSQDKLYVAYWGKGLGQIDTRNGKMKHFLPDPANMNSLVSDAPTVITIDRKDRVWIGSPDGLSHYDPSTNSFTNYFQSLDDDRTLSSNSISAIFVDPSNDVWVCAGGELNKWLENENGFRRFENRLGYPIFQFYNGETDTDENIWFIGNNKRLTYYNKFEDNFLTLKTSFTSGESIKDDNGRIYLTGTRTSRLNGLHEIGPGIASFHPDSLKYNKNPPRLTLTDLLINNEPVRPDDATTVLSKSIEYTDHISLNHTQNNFTIKYTAFEYIDPESVSFAFQLEGFDDQWQEVGKQRSATYTSLSPGDYTFRVKCKNYVGVWSNPGPALMITILPPWYWSTWTKSLYLLLLGGFIYSIYQYQLKRKLAFLEADRLRQLDTFKNNLYTNITHEFRTPLTIISGLNHQIRKDVELDRPLDIIEKSDTVARNATQLLHLVNQMLDLRKIESGNLPINLIKTDLVRFLQNIILSFTSLSNSKEVRLHFLPEKSSIITVFDPDKIHQIVSNLLSNAIKYNLIGGDVFIQLKCLEDPDKAEQLCIEIRDTGMGIPQDQLDQIFDRFYQVDNSTTRAGEGTGIGLALTRELVSLLEGSIKVESTIGKGTTFTLLIPIPSDQGVPFTQITEISPVQISTKNNVVTADLLKEDVTDSSSRILVIEDHDDLRIYLSSLLSNKYHTLLAQNGDEGLQVAFQEIPDLIVTDIMMPRIDGYELSEILKKDERTSHIPIIMLTAKADHDSKLKGLQIGADAYLVKPFNEEELFIRIEKLLELRKTLQEYYQTVFYADAQSVELQTPKNNSEDGFILKIQEIVEEHLDDHNFSVVRLCQLAGFSHSQLHRKLTATIGYSSSQFIRMIRLRKACRLLKETKDPISNIAYETGFSDPDYFSRVFKSEFGMTPTDYRVFT